MQRVQKKAISLICKNLAEIGELRNFRIELENRFGISEIQALNILRDYFIKGYCDYYRSKCDERNISIKKDDLDYLKWLAEIEEKMRAKDCDYSFEEHDIRQNVSF